ncbi:MAG: hypothetical protein RJA22_2862 [Verrucomicrobiota bacterium]
MKNSPLLLPAFLLLALTAAAASAADWVTYPGQAGPGRGKHIVLLSGDEEYRSEEALPMLGQILAERHGFTCTVLFAINPPGWSKRDLDEWRKANQGKGLPEPKPTDPHPADGTIDPNESAHIPGMEVLDRADLVIMSWRFRRPKGMQHFADYYDAGKPVIALRTSTHAFAGLPAGPHQRFNWDHGAWKGGFGKQVLGETWISHWGRHKAEATLGVNEPAASSHPILRGVGQIFGDTDVYEAHPPADATILVRGQVLKGMKPTDPPAEYRKKTHKGVEQGVNDPMQPVVWTRQHTNEAGKVNRILTTTMGSATDLQSEGLRRLLVNGAYWATGLEGSIPAQANVDYVTPFQPTMYGFNTAKKGVRPSDHERK